MGWGGGGHRGEGMEAEKWGWGDQGGRQGSREVVGGGGTSIIIVQLIPLHVHVPVVYSVFYV